MKPPLVILVLSLAASLCVAVWIANWVAEQPWVATAPVNVTPVTPTNQPTPTTISSDTGPATTEDFSKEQICKAAIAALMGRDPQIINVDRVEDDVVYTSYIRENDGSYWADRCSVDRQTQEIIWGTDTGRWRTDPSDGKVFYSADGSTLKITQEFSDGSSDEDQYTLAELSSQ